MHTWADVSITLPNGATGELRTTCPQCSASRHKNRDACLAVNIDKGIWVCHHCGWCGSLHGRSQVSTLGALPPPVRPDEHKRAALRRVWGEACPVTTGDPVETYLRPRSLALPWADRPTVLRFHPHLVYRHVTGERTYHPAMLARVDDPSGCAVTVHRTYLTPDGRKAAVPTPKKLMSPAVAGATRGGAIRLYPASE